ncbi:MAG TPA: hypothetical protein VM099_16240, partial [Gemmatimonadaceae bacterium]|nr:hypothetical protein [Gemmatimonadaceae bacterium]
MNLSRVGVLSICSVVACVDTSSKPSGAATNVTRASPAVSATSVNQATSGMRSQIRWVMPPDSSAILVVVDPVGIENDAIPNAFFFGSETRNFQARMDSVWDVAPSPDWQAIAFSRAYVLRGDQTDTIPPAEWVALSRRTGIDTATLVQSSFPTSGMAMMRGIAQPGVIRIPADIRAPNAADQAAPKTFPVARGWQVRWTPDGASIALGNNPAKSDDNEQSVSWTDLDAKTGAVHGTFPEGAKLAVARWVKGPVLEQGTSIDMNTAPPIRVKVGAKTYSVESSRGVITARETTAGADSSAIPFTIGSGKAVIATRGGRYIVALAPRRSA